MQTNSQFVQSNKRDWLMCLFHRKFPRDDVPAKFIRLTSLTTSFRYHAETFLSAYYFKLRLYRSGFWLFSKRKGYSISTHSRFAKNKEWTMEFIILCSEHKPRWFVFSFTASPKLFNDRMPWSLELIFIFLLSSLFGIQCSKMILFFIYWNGKIDVHIYRIIFLLWFI